MRIKLTDDLKRRPREWSILRYLLSQFPNGHFMKHEALMKHFLDAYRCVCWMKRMSIDGLDRPYTWSTIVRKLYKSCFNRKKWSIVGSWWVDQFVVRHSVYWWSVIRWKKKSVGDWLMLCGLLLVNGRWFDNMRNKKYE